MPRAAVSCASRDHAPSHPVPHARFGQSPAMFPPAPTPPGRRGPQHARFSVLLPQAQINLTVRGSSRDPSRARYVRRLRSGSEIGRLLRCLLALRTLLIRSSLTDTSSCLPWTLVSIGEHPSGSARAARAVVHLKTRRVAYWCPREIIKTGGSDYAEL
ncbi:hypothetical protein BD310DRAFT_911084 [Dichomitus squalens]|uniref:Uncharacterized protein n=1 Tax=Dichomitus squalens TaxID=114155 RepID=A0A4Q9QC74_9APHY|nr:hypothetical protein BD310DRAFT_911084 [Dichomitus squalens]